MLVMATALPFGGVGASPAGGDHLPRAREARCRCRLRGWRHGPLPAPASARDDVHAPAASVGADADGQRLAVHRPVGPLGARAGTRPARTRARGPQGRGRAGASAAHARRGGSGYLRGAVGDLAGPAAHAALAGAADAARRGGDVRHGVAARHRLRAGAVRLGRGAVGGAAAGRAAAAPRLGPAGAAPAVRPVRRGRRARRAGHRLRAPAAGPLRGRAACRAGGAHRAAAGTHADRAGVARLDRARPDGGGGAGRRGAGGG